MCWQQAAAAGLIGFGTVLTLVALVSAVRVGRADIRVARARVDDMVKLEAERQADMLDHKTPTYQDDRKAHKTKWEDRYAEKSLELPTYDNLPRLALMETVHLAESVLAHNERNGKRLVGGLILAAVGSIWSIWL